ncbi:MAG TPA: hypothetical protein DEH78_11720, partial [Solibacterales bacterium]|nr:hypothetical protein [Bryobacterales bacterium]
RLEMLQLEPRQVRALSAITAGAASRMLLAGKPLASFLEEVEYQGRRLAKLNLPPNVVVAALQEYDRLLAPLLKKAAPGEQSNFRWVREQLHFCVILTLNNAYYQVRELETRAFYELSRCELEAVTLDELLQGSLATLVRFANASAGHLFLLNDAGTAWVLRASTANGIPAAVRPLSAPNTPALRRRLGSPKYFRTAAAPAGTMLDGSWAGRFACFWSIPIASGPRIAGVVQFAFPREYEWLPRELELLTGAAERCLRAAEKARLVDDLAAHKVRIQQLAERMLQVEEAERRRISRELHDEAGQSLLCVRLQLEMLEASLPEEQAQAKAKLNEIRDVTEHAILEIRRLLAALSPAVLEQIGLAAAVRQLVSKLRQLHPCRVRLHLSRLQNVPKQFESIVYRLVQECCNNIAKHSGASNVNISVSASDGLLSLEVEDDGVGFDVEEAFARRGGYGLAGLRERVAVLGGSCSIESVVNRRPTNNATPAVPQARAARQIRLTRDHAEASESGRVRRGTILRIQLPLHQAGAGSGRFVPATTEPVREQRAAE